MKKILIYICLLSVTFYCDKILALECSSSDKERLQKLANNISVIVEEENNGNGNIVFSATFTGISDDIRIFNPKNWMYYRNLSNSDIGEVTINNLYQGTSYRFEIYSSTGACSFKIFRTITLSIPKYNKYYSDPICENVKEYKLCQKWIDNDNMPYDEFLNKVNNYIEESKKENNNLEESSSDNQFDFDFGKFYKIVYFPSLVVTLILTGLLIYFWSKENKKNRL